EFSVVLQSQHACSHPYNVTVFVNVSRAAVTNDFLSGATTYAHYWQTKALGLHIDPAKALITSKVDKHMGVAINGAHILSMPEQFDVMTQAGLQYSCVNLRPAFTRTCKVSTHIVVAPQDLLHQRYNQVE